MLPTVTDFRLTAPPSSTRGHDASRTETLPNPKTVDQPAFTLSGSRTQNGKFCEAAENYKRGLSGSQSVRVYEKIHQGIWSYNGLFNLVDAWCERDQGRNVFKFKLVAVTGEETSTNLPRPQRMEVRRLIPTEVKVEVWRRDNGRCVQCGATDELHFDHVLPYSKGGTSLTAANVQLLCARHNLSKGARII